VRVTGPQLAAVTSSGLSAPEPLATVRPPHIAAPTLTPSLRQSIVGRNAPAARDRVIARRPRRLAEAAPASSAAVILSRIVRVIPTVVWIILAVSLALAAIAGASALRSAHRARGQELSLAAFSAAALTDPLTGVLNRRGFIEAAERELARAERYGRPFAVAYVDVRGLKTVNDTEGHLAGDELLRQVALLLRESARADDVVGRLGGDELGVLLAEQTIDGAAVVTSRIHERLPAYRATMAFDAPWDVTIGTAAYPEDGEDLEELLRTADRRLYAQRGITLR
jgi:diguanylate cyclase (GGDEF)-like protein